MDFVKTGQYTISLINAVINGTLVKEIPDGIEWMDVLEFSEKHKISNIIGYIIDLVPEVPEYALKFFKEKMKAAILLDAQQDYAIEKICDEFDNFETDYVLLKGTVLKSLYPSRDMRTMSDIDFFVKKGSMDTSREIMSQNGAKILLSNTEEDNYQIDTNLFIEIHRELVGEEYPLYHKYYSGIWDKVIPVNKHRYEMTDEDYYIYHVVHLAKHYQYYGVGLRFFLDAHIYLQKMNDKLDWEYLNRELAKLKLEKFNKYLLDLVNMWFSDGDSNDILNGMEKFVFSAGVYGNYKNREVRKAIKTTGANKIRYYLKAVFPSLRIMSEKYPALHKMKFLLPLCWIHRIIKESKLRIKNRRFVTKNKDITSEDKTDLINHLQTIGLN